MTCSRGVTLIELVKSEPELVKQAVAQETAPYKALRALDMSGNTHKAKQLCDAILYYGWNTDHWSVPIEGEPIHDWDNPELLNSCAKNSKGNEIGRKFELLVEERLESCLKHSSERYELFGESESELASAYLTEDLGFKVNLSKWDNTVWFPKEERLVLVESKAASTPNARRRLRHQLTKRLPEIESLRASGVDVVPLAVLGTDDTMRITRRVLEFHEIGGWSGGMGELSSGHLLTVDPSALVSLPANNISIPPEWEKKLNKKHPTR